MRRFLSAIFVFTFLSQSFAANIFSSASAVPGTKSVVLSWETKSETDVKSFVILRSNDDKVYIILDKKAAHGPGTKYEYFDQNVMFKDFSAVFYKIRAINSNGQTIEETSVRAIQNVSDMTVTWGAIKKLFR